MLKISFTQTSAGAAMLVLEGRLIGPWVVELQSAVNAAGKTPEELHLDLSGVKYADAAGVDLLLLLSQHGVRLEGLSPFIEELLVLASEPISATEQPTEGDRDKHGRTN